MAEAASEKEDDVLEDVDLKMPPVGDVIGSETSEDTADVSATKVENKKVESLDVVAKLQAEVKEAQSKYLYAIAETDNIKKRHLKERSELIKYQGESIARDLLEILDDLDRVSGVGSEANSEAILEGVQLIASRMRSIFDRYSIKGEDAVGSKFDPAKHEALTMVNSPDIDSGVVIQELKKSYYYKDKLLRPAQVVVSNGPAKSSE